MNDPKTRLARAFPVGVTAIVAMMLGYALFNVQRSLRRAERLVGAGEAQLLASRIQDAVASTPTEAQLASVFEQFRGEGLLYLRHPLGPGRAPFERGEPSAMPIPRNSGATWVGGNRVRLVTNPLPPAGGPGRGRPPPRFGPGPEGRKGRGPRGARPPLGPPGPGAPPLGGPPRLILEIEPRLTGALEAEHVRLAVVGSLAAATLLASGLLLTWLMAQRERLALARAEERQLATLGRTSAVLAHELRNPLASLKGHAQLLEERLEATPDAKKATRVVKEAVRLERLVGSLLTFLRSGRAERVSTNIEALLARATQNSRATDVRHRVHGHAMVAEVDPDRIEAALVNLLDNAADAAPGTEVVLFAERSGDELVLGVEDAGPGLGGAGASVFETLYSRKPGGTGLGLALVRQVAEAHGGKAVAADRVEGGARLALHLPL